MAQFDVHRQPGKHDLLVNCQSNLLAHLETRFVIPLVRHRDGGPAATRLNPFFQIDDVTYVLAANLAATVPVRALGPVIASLDEHHLEIKSALDMLVSGI
jgi:toxin CcdB